MTQPWAQTTWEEWCPTQEALEALRKTSEGWRDGIPIVTIDTPEVRAWKASLRKTMQAEVEKNRPPRDRKEYIREYQRARRKRMREADLMWMDDELGDVREYVRSF